MNQIEVSQISKSFGRTKAVNNVSFGVESGEIFGLLGPNGAGKTTIIRIILDIFKPDSGTVSILGGPMAEKKKNFIGYMPEERGLYLEATLERCLHYLGSLKGLSKSEAHQRIVEYLEKFELIAHRKKKIRELSKGMQQKAQIIATILHQPKLIIIDEPFTSLDPVNTLMVKEVILDLARQGTTILMSTHQMHKVEELCDRILLIDSGKVILYGKLIDIRHKFSGNAVLIQTSSDLPQLKGIENIARDNNNIKLTLKEGSTPQDVLKDLVANNVVLNRYEIALPTLDEIFIKVVKEGKE